MRLPTGRIWKALLGTREILGDEQEKTTCSIKMHKDTEKRKTNTALRHIKRNIKEGFIGPWSVPKLVPERNMAISGLNGLQIP